jgi:hypothetical protein
MADDLLSPVKMSDETSAGTKASDYGCVSRKVFDVVFTEGRRTHPVATVSEFLDNRTPRSHHWYLVIHYTEWNYRLEKLVCSAGYGTNELACFYKFLKALTKEGRLRAVSSPEYARLEQLVGTISALVGPAKMELVKAVLPRIDGTGSHVNDFLSVLENSDPQVVQNIGAAARMVEYRRAYDRMVGLVEDTSVTEQALQKHLQENPWMFGSEYSELLDRRKWTRDESLDYMLRRTADNFLEIAEIKTPLKDALMVYDKSHKSYYPSAKLSSVLGQVMRYIEEVERNRDHILAKDNCDTLKIKARVIIGRDGAEQHQSALRNLNAHLHRIEVITFDQLLRIAGRVLAVFEHGPAKAEENAAS